MKVKFTKYTVRMTTDSLSLKKTKIFELKDPISFFTKAFVWQWLCHEGWAKAKGGSFIQCDLQLKDSLGQIFRAVFFFFGIL